MFGLTKKIEEIKQNIHKAIVISKVAGITYAVMFILIFAMNIFLLVKVFQIESLLK